MPRVEGIEKLLSAEPHGRFGKPWEFGEIMAGFSNFGGGPVFFSRSLFGKAVFGGVFFGDVLEFSGIYHVDHDAEGRFLLRTNYVITKNPRSIPQQAHRHKYGQAVGAWRLLTSEQKAVYNKNAVGHRMTGCNLFIKEFMLS